jgi:ATP-dependent helicase/nuclease subunit A
MNYTPQQQQAIESRARYICVDAGAGSGKTRVLVDRIVHLIATEQARLEEIVAITFTEKAALEMKERLRKAFRRNAPKDDPIAFSQWRDLERRVDTAHITTIHAFCSRLLRENALYLGLDPDFGLISDAETALMLQEAVESVMIGLLEKSDPAMLRLASSHTLTELQGLCKGLLLQRGVVDRIRRSGGMETPEAVLATWRTQADAEQARYLTDLGRNCRVNALLHALRGFARLCDDPAEGREAWRASMVDGLEALQAGASIEAAGNILRGFLKNPFGNGKKKLWPSEEIYEALADLQKKVTEFAQAALMEGKNYTFDDNLTAESAQLASDLLQLDDKVNAAYEKAKRDASLLDFDDLVLFALKVLREKDTLRQQTAKRIKFLLLDEFQDTDGQQLELARLLHDEAEGPALFIVGDPKQSIYYFRGAEVEIFHQERDASSEIVRLDRNFRSLPDVLGFVNDFFQHSNLLCAVERYQPMGVQRASAGGARVGFILSDQPHDFVGKWNVAEYRSLEASQIAAQIQRLCAPDSTSTIEDEHSGAIRRPDYGDIALLFRATSNVGLYEEALRKAGIPYTVVAGAGFYERQEVVDVINILKVLSNPWDEHALLAYLRGPVVALSDDDLVRLCNQGTLTEIALGERMPEGLTHPERLLRARAIVHSLRDQLAGPLPALVDHLLEITGLEAVLLSQFLGLQKASNVRKLANLAREQAGRGNLSLRQFVNYLDEVHAYQIREGEAGLQPDGEGSVTLMTIHKSKGLEFPVVFLPDMAQAAKGPKEHTLQIHRQLGITLRVARGDGDRADTRLGALIKRRIKEEEGAESARVLYVALTRARDMLYLCGQAEASLGTWFQAFDLLHDVSGALHGQVVAGRGWNAEVIRNLPEARGVAMLKSVKSDDDIETTRRRIAPALLPVRSVESISVSKLLMLMVPGEVDPEEARYERSKQEENFRQFAMDRGTLVHRMFEVWDFAGTAPDVRGLVRAAGLGLGRRGALEEELAAIHGWFSASSLGARLAGEKDLLREAPFSLRIGDTIVNGTIDLALNDGTVIDYKTGKIKDESSARYEKQLLLYAAALRDLAGIAPKEGFLVYVDAHEVKGVEFTTERIEATLKEAREALFNERD